VGVSVGGKIQSPVALNVTVPSERVYVTLTVASPAVLKGGNDSPPAKKKDTGALSGCPGTLMT